MDKEKDKNSYAEINPAFIRYFEDFKDRILEHHHKFDSRFDSLENKLRSFQEILYKNEIEREKSISAIKDELHGRINTILFSILGGSGAFILGIILWLVESKR